MIYIMDTMDMIINENIYFDSYLVINLNNCILIANVENNETVIID